jgi:hypothetical protein
MKSRLFLVKPRPKPPKPVDEFGVGPERQRAFDDHRAALLQELSPQGALEMAYFDRLVHASWILERCRVLEAEILARGLEAVQDDESARTLDYLQRRATAAHSVYSRALKGLLSRKRTPRE